jgi:TolB-like protein/DNA-binding winged helix-turn-helix (wHTH) protein/Tfp pilus assembly protein PilF
MPVPAQAAKARLDLSRYELSVEGRKVKLERQPMELLIFFAQRQGQLVSREEIIDKLWGKDVFVDVDSSINAAVRKIRHALRDDPANPRYLETVVGKGYRFVGTIELAGNLPEHASGTPAGSLASAVADISAPSAEAPSTSTPARRLLLVGLLMTVVAVIAAAAWTFAKRRNANASAQTDIRSIAVLPLQNLSGDPSQDYFADGMTEELITELGKIDGLQVISRTSVMRYKGTNRALPEIARELHADAIVEGSVARAANQVRITAQLIDASSDKHMWSQSYQRALNDVLSIQDEVAADIAQQVQRHSNAGSARHSVPSTFNAEAYEAYLQGRYLMSDGDEPRVLRATEAFKQCLQLEPNYAPAYASLAESYLWLGWKYLPQARAAAERAVALDPQSGEGHWILGASMMSENYDWTGADRELTKAIQLNPNSADAHEYRATYLAAVGRLQEAVSEAERARNLDPVSASTFETLGVFLYFAHSYDAAIANEQRSLYLNSSLKRPHYWIGHLYNQKGMYQQAIAEIQKVDRSQDEDGIYLAALGRSYALAGERANASRVAREFERLAEHEHVWPTDAAFFYAALGQNDRAFYWLEKAVQEKDGWLFFVNVDPRLDSLRSDPRYLVFLHRVGLDAGKPAK